MPWCNVCGAEERAHDRFRDDPSILRRTRRICPSCDAHRHAHRSRAIGSRVFGATILAMMVLAVGRVGDWWPAEAAGWAILNGVTIVILIAALTLPHEAAHALVSRALGMRVYRIRIGTGRLVYRSTIAGADVRLHAVPWSGGLTLYAPLGLRWARTRRALVAVAGPAVHAVLLAIAFVVGVGNPLGALTGLRPLLAFALANAFLLVVNLFPWRAPGVEGVLESDGLVLIKTPFLGARELTEHLAAQYVVEASLLSEDGHFEQACERARAGLAAHPQSLVARLNVGLMLALAGRCAEARESFRDVLAQPDVPREMQATLRNNVAWASLMLGDLEEADALSAQAVEDLGWVRALQGTRGAVLVARGRLDEGLVLLAQALDRPEQLHPMARATYEAATALGLAGQGDRATAEAHLARARDAFATCPLLPRVEAALAEGPAVLSAPDGMR